MREREPKCPRCAGWAFEPEHHPVKPCTECGGTGKPRSVPRFLEEAAR